jgi:spermidine synthase
VSRPAFFFASFLSLFLEVLLIRWCGAEIRILAYLRNLTLLGCFLGLGLGYAASSRRRLPVSVTFLATALLVLSAPAMKSLSSLLNFADMNSWLHGSNDKDKLLFLFGLGLLCLLYALLALAFFPLGQALGDAFAKTPKEARIRAYTWNVLASLAGVGAFFALSFVEAPPLLWFAVAALAALLACESGRDRAGVLLLAVLTLGLLHHQEAEEARAFKREGDRWQDIAMTASVVETRWSPYQKIQLVKEHYRFEKLSWEDHSAYVNGHWYSRVGTTDLAAAESRSLASGSRAPFEFEYSRQIPYWVAPAHEKVLLLGAGMGRDAATALAQGAREVDVVEIEDRFVKWGTELHPAQPYKDARVHVHVDDARRFLRAAPEGGYDLVVFCYLDSHGLTSNFTNTNLDSYVYTEESLRDARRVLKEGGVCAIGFSSPRPFIYARLGALMERVFSSPPVRVNEDLFLSVRGDAARAQEFRARAARALAGNLRPLEGEKPPLTTDDWPFFYLESAQVPMVFRFVLVSVALLSLVSVRVGVGRIGRIDAHFLLLGAAFMLLETWAISRASLVYGATWYVSSAVIASLLVAILLANALVEKKGPVRLGPAFLALSVGLLAATLLDPSRMLGLPRAAQLLLAAPLYAIPFLFASLVFASSFAKTSEPRDALASNLLGSVLGGALECLSFATGLRALGFVALGLYLGAWVVTSSRREMR